MNSCGNCVYHLEGECRRYPPTRNLVEYRSGDGSLTGTLMENLQPETPDDYWCGEWKERITYVFLEDLKKRIDALP